MNKYSEFCPKRPIKERGSKNTQKRKESPKSPNYYIFSENSKKKRERKWEKNGKNP